MSTTVTYKGNTLTTVNNQTRVLNTSGKWMEGDITLVDVTSSGTAAISVVDTTDTAGGTIRTITALDISDTTATASDVASGKYFYTAAGVKTPGTASGGGGGSGWTELLNDDMVINTDTSPYYFAVSPFSESFDANEGFLVTWGSGGTSYFCQTRADIYNVSYDGYFIGNPGAYGGTDDGSGAPFLMYRSSSSQLLCITTATGTIHVILQKLSSSGGGGGGGSATLITKSIAANGTYSASNDSADGYSSVTVNVPNSYAAGDEGKVVYNGALTSQTSATYTTNNTYDTTRINSVTVSVSGGGTPSATSHTIYFEFSDSTNTSIIGYWDDSFISNAITATEPSTYSSKTVTLAALDGTTWYEPANIPLNTQLIDFTKVTEDYVINSSGAAVAEQWYSVSDYTPVASGMTFSYTGCRWYYLAFYDSSKTYIAGSAMNMYGDTTESTYNSNCGDGTLSGNEIPASAAYIRITSVGGPDEHELSLIRTA